MAAARVLCGLSQAELAAKAGIHVNVLKRLEAGTSNPRRSTLDALLAVFAAYRIEFLGETADRVDGIARKKDDWVGRSEA